MIQCYMAPDHFCCIPKQCDTYIANIHNSAVYDYLVIVVESTVARFSMPFANYIEYNIHTMLVHDMKS